MQFHLDNVKRFIGSALENAASGEDVPVCHRAILTSDDERFHGYLRRISEIFLRKNLSLVTIYRFLVVIHKDQSADVYVNDFFRVMAVAVKQTVDVAEIVEKNNTADIREVSFPKIEIQETDSVIYCLRNEWRFGLFFDFSSSQRTDEGMPPLQLSLSQMKLSIGELYRRLFFYDLYKERESVEEMKKDGWFPFVEILGDEYERLKRARQQELNRESTINQIVSSFTPERIKRITDKWWGNPFFAEKRSLIEAGVNAYLQNTEDGIVNCITTLWSQIEGVLRNIYGSARGSSDEINATQLCGCIREKATNKSGSNNSLLLAKPFEKYLNEVCFPTLKAAPDVLSRNTVCHGVASPEQYTKEKALQLILILDQIYFCL